MLHRLAGALAAFLVVLSASPVSAQTTTTTTQPPKNNDCGVLFIRPPSVVCDVAGAVIGGSPLGPVLAAPNALGDAAAGVVGAVGGGAMESLTRWVAEGAVWLMKEVGGVIMRTTTPNLTAPWALEKYKRMASLAVLLLAVFLLAAIVRGVRTNDVGAIARAVGVSVPGAVFATVTAVAFVQMLLIITDGMSAYIASNMDRDLARFVDGAIGTMSTGAGLVGAASGVALPSFLTFIGALILGFAALIIWIELLLRSAAIYIAVAFLPLIFSAAVWPAAAKWAKRAAEVLLALIVTKFVIVGVVALAAAGLGAGSATGFSGLLSAGAALLVAAFSPKALFGLVQMAELAVTGPGRQSMPSPMHTTSGQMAVHRIMYQRSSSVAARAPMAALGPAAAAGVVAGGAAGVASGRTAQLVPAGATSQGSRPVSRSASASAATPPAGTAPAAPPSPPGQSTKGTAPSAPRKPPTPRGPTNV